MRILVVHPVMSFLGGGERLCCESIRALVLAGHKVTLLSEQFDEREVESFFGYKGLFDEVNMLLYPRKTSTARLGSYSHIIHALRSQHRKLRNSPVDLIFSTQDPGYIPDLSLGVVQWGYFPRQFASYPRRSLASVLRAIPLRVHYNQKISRIGLVLAISEYSKSHLDSRWNRPSVVVYPSCNMVFPRKKQDIVITVARAIPEKRLELFWDVARLVPNYEFRMLLTTDPGRASYFTQLAAQKPQNGQIVTNPRKHEYDQHMGEAKVYLHLMRGEHFGITIVEAMSAGCMPIVHNSGGPKEIVGTDIGFIWNSVEELPGLIRSAMGQSPCDDCVRRAELFSSRRFEENLSSVFSQLGTGNP